MVRQNIYIRILLHLLFWSMYVIGCILIYGLFGSPWANIAEATLELVPAIAIPTYFILYVVIPEFLLRRKYIISLLFYLLLPVGFVALQRYVVLVFDIAPLKDGTTFKDLINVQFILVSFESYLMISIAVGIKLLKRWIVDQQIRRELELQNVKSELNLMRAQVNPHFLFNALNNIHSYIQYDSEKSAEAVIKLSEIMRYMLYETSGDKVPLKKEINYIKSYISLQLLKFESEDAVLLKIEGNPNGKIIAPMLFITFLENAFKHGNKNHDFPAIKIYLNIEDKKIVYRVTNYINPTKMPETKYNGFGIKNLQKRLDLIYGDKYKMEIDIEKDEYIAKLVLND